MTYQQDENLNNFEIVLSEQAISKVQMYHQYSVDYVMLYILYIIGYEDKIIGRVQSPHCKYI